MPDLPNIPATEAAIIELTNVFRQSEKLGAVKSNAALTRAAKSFAEYLAKTGGFAHEADGRHPQDRAKAAGYGYCMVAENLAMNLDSRGFTVAKLAWQVVEGWKNSPGHRRNLLSPGATEIGVGIARAPGVKDPKYLSVQLFGRPESLKATVKVKNTLSSAVSYTLHGRATTINPGMLITHTSCQAGTITFDRAGNWLTGTSIKSTFEARDGTLFTLKTGAAGRVVVETSSVAKK
jgi:hypothetical protein